MLLPDVNSTIPNIYKPETIMTTIKRIEKKRGTLRLSNHSTIGYITNASNKAIVKGKITDAAIFKTDAAIITHIKTIKKKTARPE